MPSAVTSAPTPVEHLGTDGGALIVDETGFVKKGRASAGVQHQCPGTAGRIENSQAGVLVAYATSRGRTLIDRRLYQPEQAWCSDPERRQGARLTETVQFQTKLRLAREAIATALEARGTGYVMAVVCSRAGINAGRTAMRADTVAERLPAAWQRHGPGQRREGPTLLRLGPDPHRHRRTSPPARPPQPRHRRTHLLPVLVT
ncbi:transposase [Streptomyces sp. NPDC018026]|uniref:transposase n=1 Tax=Streptomyces sp. NPDC018026 TaxID=3365031 RepID=UPI0037908EED